tara:strand:+ start:1870 stop:1986 length:117 start_codon:yes stop_codon:yes gene_type:complete
MLAATKKTVKRKMRKKAGMEKIEKDLAPISPLLSLHRL